MFSCNHEISKNVTLADAPNGGRAIIRNEKKANLNSN